MKYNIVRASTKEVLLETDEYSEAEAKMHTSGGLVIHYQDEALAELNALPYASLKAMGFSFGEEHFRSSYNEI